MCIQILSHDAKKNLCVNMIAFILVLTVPSRLGKCLTVDLHAHCNLWPAVAICVGRIVSRRYFSYVCLSVCFISLCEAWWNHCTSVTAGWVDRIVAVLYLHYLSWSFEMFNAQHVIHCRLALPQRFNTHRSIYGVSEKSEQFSCLYFYILAVF